MKTKTALLKPRSAKTNRGEDTRLQILDAALPLLCQRWASEIPYTELASAAGVARASLLHAFPHWRDVLYDIFYTELEPVTDWYVEAKALKRARPDARAFAMLRPLLDRAESTGVLYPNLRSAMFNWHGEPRPEEDELDQHSSAASPAMLGAFVRIQLDDHFALIEELLGAPAQPGKPIGECLMNFALDLAAGSPSYRGTFDERRETLRRAITVLSNGIRSSKA